MAKGIKEGKMEHWGISNYSIDEVKKIINICEANEYPKPVVYQGHYNALTRKMEEKLLPVLRQNKNRILRIQSRGRRRIFEEQLPNGF